MGEAQIYLSFCLDKFYIVTEQADHDFSLAVCVSDVMFFGQFYNKACRKANTWTGAI